MKAIKTEKGEIRIKLEADDFKELVSGGIIENKNIGVTMCLADIGYDYMLSILEELSEELHREQ